MKIEDVTIIGAGPAGVACAVQLKRQGITPYVIEKEKVGGLIRNANLMENYPGFPYGVSGIKLTGLLKRHLENQNIDVHNEQVDLVNWENGRFKITTSKPVINSKILVIASGTRPLPIPITILGELKERVWSEVYPLREIQGQNIAIVGSGDAAFDYALNLAGRNIVSILNRSKITKCLPLLRERVSEAHNITYYDKIQLSAISKGEDSIVLSCLDTTGKREMAVEMTVDHLVFAIGRVSALEFLGTNLLENRKELEEKGLLYIIGDAGNGLFRQASIAAGDGVRTAMKIQKYLLKNR